MTLPPTVFHHTWPEHIQNDLNSAANPAGSITNSDLELVALLFLFLIVEVVVSDLQDKHGALYSNNSPSIHWVQRLAAKNSPAVTQLIWALSLRLHMAKASPLTMLHITGTQNSMTDVPSHSFGHKPKWHCPTDKRFLTLYNSMFSPPTQHRNPGMSSASPP